jgi:hypothetical protein
MQSASANSWSQARPPYQPGLKSVPEQSGVSVWSEGQPSAGQRRNQRPCFKVTNPEPETSVGLSDLGITSSLSQG